MSLELRITAMTCDACARHVSDALQHVGARTVDVDWRGGRPTLDPDGAAPGDLARALEGTKYVAAKHGALVVENAFERAGRRIDYAALPRITFTNPTIAPAGLTAAQAHEQGLHCHVRVLALEHVPRAIVSRDTLGLVKLVAERRTGRTVRAHIVGDGADDVILAASLAIQTGMTVDQLASGRNPYLTLGEGLFLAAQSFSRDPAALSCCAA